VRFLEHRPGERQQIHSKEWLKDALQKLSRAQAHESDQAFNDNLGEAHIYSKIYLRQAQIMALSGQYEDAMQKVEMAIANLFDTKEDQTIKRDEYEMVFEFINRVRETDYKDIRLLIKEETSPLEEKLKSQRLTVSAVCTFVLSVISFIIGSLSIFNQEGLNFAELVSLIVAYAGILIVLCSLVCFSITVIFAEDADEDTDMPKSSYSKEVTRLHKGSIIGLICGAVIFIVACIAPIICELIFIK